MPSTSSTTTTARAYSAGCRSNPFRGPLRLIVSTLPGVTGTDDPLAVIQTRQWPERRVEPLTVPERRQMITDYLARVGKTLDAHRLDRIASAAPAANPLYLKSLLDDLRVTGTHGRLDERLTAYLEAADIPTLLQQVLARYERDYERDRPGLVGEALGLIYAARRGLSETELLHLLRPADQAQLPPAHWAPLRAALADALVDRGGVLNFSHDYLRTAVGHAFAADGDRRDDLRRQLADDFEAQAITARTCDELPWLLKETASFARLRVCLLHIDRFLLIKERDEDELRRYWVEQLQEQHTMGGPYLDSFQRWSREPGRQERRIAYAANQLGQFLFAAALHAEAEPLMQRALEIFESSLGENHPNVATQLNNLAVLLQDTNRLGEAEPLMRRALEIDEQSLGPDHPTVAIDLNNLARLLQATNRLGEAEPLMRRALDVSEQSFGPDHPTVAIRLNNLAQVLQATNRLGEAEPLMRRALDISESSLGPDHPDVAMKLNNLAGLLKATNRHGEAEPLLRRALDIDEQSFGPDHPSVAIHLNNLALLLQATNRHGEAEPLMRRALEIDEQSFGPDHPRVATRLNNLAQLLQDTNRLGEAEPLMRRMVEIFVKFTRATGHQHPHLQAATDNYAALLKAMGRSREEIIATLRGMDPELLEGQ